MKKNIIVLLVVCLMVFSLFGCSNDNNTNGNENKMLTVEDIVEVEGIYCLHEDGTVSSGGMLTEMDYDTDLYRTGDEPLYIDRGAGDRLIYVGDMVYLNDANDSSFEMDYKAEKYYYSGYLVNVDRIEVFEGEELLGNYEMSFENYGFDYIEDDYSTPTTEGYIVSKEPKAYSYGCYDGTEYIEVERNNNIPFYDVDYDEESAFEATVIKGTEGYFTIDLTAVEAGVYINDFDSGSWDEYAIEIK